MSQMNDLFKETIQNNPDLNLDDLRDLVMETIIDQVPQKLADVDIPQGHIRFNMLKNHKYRSRLSMPSRIEEKEKEKEKVEFFNSLLSVQEALNEDLNDFKQYSSYEKFQHPHMFLNLPISDYKTRSVIDYNESHLSISKNNIKKDNNRIRPKPYDVIKTIETLSHNKVTSYELTYDKVYDKILNIKMSLGVKDTLQIWLVAIDNIDSNFAKMINLEWEGDLDISDEEFINYAVKIMLKSGLGPRALEGFDAAELVSEERR